MDEAHASRLQGQRLLACCNSLRYLSENGIESPWILSLYFQDKSKEWNSVDDQLRLRWMIYLVVLADAAETIRDAMRFNYHLSILCALFEALYGRKCRSSVLWAEIGESSLTGLERKPLEFEDRLRIRERIGLVAYRLRLPKELNSVHDTFHVSNLRKCLADANLHVPLDEIKVDKTLCFVKEPVEI
ncbi:hypothetical protein Tco_0928912, partial [Tanacetum coccineum]